MKHAKVDRIMAWLPSTLLAQQKEIKRDFINSKRTRVPDTQRVRRRLTASEAEYFGYFVKGILDTNYAGRSRASQTMWLKTLVDQMDNEATKQHRRTIEKHVKINIKKHRET